MLSKHDLYRVVAASLTISRCCRSSNVISQVPAIRPLPPHSTASSSSSSSSTTIATLAPKTGGVIASTAFNSENLVHHPNQSITMHQTPRGTATTMGGVSHNTNTNTNTHPRPTHHPSATTSVTTTARHQTMYQTHPSSIVPSNSSTTSTAFVAPTTTPSSTSISSVSLAAPISPTKQLLAQSPTSAFASCPPLGLILNPSQRTNRSFYNNKKTSPSKPQPHHSAAQLQLSTASDNQYDDASLDEIFSGFDIDTLTQQGSQSKTIIDKKPSLSSSTVQAPAPVAPRHQTQHRQHVRLNDSVAPASSQQSRQSTLPLQVQHAVADAVQQAIPSNAPNQATRTTSKDTTSPSNCSSRAIDANTVARVMLNRSSTDDIATPKATPAPAVRTNSYPLISSGQQQQQQQQQQHSSSREPIVSSYTSAKPSAIDYQAQITALQKQLQEVRNERQASVNENQLLRDQMKQAIADKASLEAQLQALDNLSASNITTTTTNTSSTTLQRQNTEQLNTNSTNNATNVTPAKSSSGGGSGSKMRKSVTELELFNQYNVCAHTSKWQHDT
jgi:hypothetical protein